MDPFQFLKSYRAYVWNPLADHESPEYAHHEYLAALERERVKRAHKELEDLVDRDRRARGLDTIANTYRAPWSSELSSAPPKYSDSVLWRAQESIALEKQKAGRKN